MKPSAFPPRFAHLWFSRLATDRAHRSRPSAATEPLALADKLKNALRLTAVDEAAEREGLCVGMTVADARARRPDLRIARADPAADLALLERLAEACRRHTPALALHAPDGIDLNLTGCAGLFGGEDALLAEIRARFDLSLQAAIADTPGLAYAVARFGRGGAVPVGVRAEILAGLPIAALRIEADSVEVLRHLGLKRIGQIQDIPRAALTRRLGETALHRLDEAMGLRAGPLDLRLETPRFMVQRRMFEPIADEAQVLQVTSDLAADLATALDMRGRGGRRFRLDLFRVDGAVKRLGVAASTPLRDPRRIAALFIERLAGLNEGLEADFGFDQLRLTAETTDTVASRATDLLDTSGVQDSARGLADLADRLAARTGARIVRLAPGDAHRPERATRTVDLNGPGNWTDESPARFEDAPLRPLRLFTPPQRIEVSMAEAPEGPPRRFTWRRVVRTVVRAEGPERIEPEWAVDDAETPVRDYYRLEDETGRRYWVFRQHRYDAPPARRPGQPQPDEDAPPPSLPVPTWRLHGLFG